MAYKVPDFVIALHMDAKKRGQTITTFSGQAHGGLQECQERLSPNGIKYDLKTMTKLNDLPLQAVRDFIEGSRLIYLPVTINHPIVDLPNGRRESYYSQSEEHMNLYVTGQLKPSQITLPAFLRNLNVVGYVSGARINEKDKSLLVQLDIDESLIRPNDFHFEHISNGQFPISLTHFIYGPESGVVDLNEIVPTEIALVTKQFEPRRPGSIVSRGELKL